MGKLGAIAGDTTTTVIDMTPGAVPGSMVNGPEDLIDWDAITGVRLSAGWPALFLVPVPGFCNCQ
jgi:hypothetical protein